MRLERDAGGEPSPRLAVGRKAHICDLREAGEELIDPNGPQVTIEVTRPDGTSVEQRTLAPTNATRWIFVPRPGYPDGTYTITVRQGDRVAIRGNIVLERASQPSIAVVPPAGFQGDVSAEGAPGDVFEVMLGGFPGPAEVPLYLYSTAQCTRVPTPTPSPEGEPNPDEEGPRTCYVTALPPARTNARGEAAYEFPSLPDDPPGTYYLTSSPADRSILSQFSLRTPGSNP